MSDLHLSSSAELINLRIGPSKRLFAAHEDILRDVPFFQEQYKRHGAARIDILDEEPEIFSCVLEFLYKGDYTPKLDYNEKSGTWKLEDWDNGTGTAERTVFHNGVGRVLLKDTVIYVRTLTTAFLTSVVTTVSWLTRSDYVALVRSRAVRTPRTQASGTQETGSAAWRTVQHHSI